MHCASCAFCSCAELVALRLLCPELLALRLLCLLKLFVIVQQLGILGIVDHSLPALLNDQCTCAFRFGLSLLCVAAVQLQEQCQAGQEDGG